MTDLERRALLGDRQAQEECTEKGIVLACPWCGCDERDMIGLSVYHEQYFYNCEACGCNGPVVFDNDTCDYPEHEALVKWNTRHATPVGRCGDCAADPSIDDAPAIDPEELPIVRQLREKLKNEIAKKEICGETIERLDKQLEKVTAERDKIAQYELDACGEYCFGDSSTGISECEWLYSNGRCKLKEWAEGRKETDRE